MVVKNGFKKIQAKSKITRTSKKRWIGLFALHIRGTSKDLTKIFQKKQRWNLAFIFRAKIARS